MKPPFLLIIFTLLLVSQINLVQSQNVAGKKSILDTLLVRRDSLQISMILLHIDEFKNRTRALRMQNKYDTIYHIFDQLKAKEIEEVFNWFKHFFATQKTKGKDRIRSLLNSWLRFGDIILFSVSSDEIEAFDELIYNIKSTRPLFNKYLTSSDQYWGSLTFTQSGDIYYDCMNYVSHLSNKSQIIFYKEYFE